MVRVMVGKNRLVNIFLLIIFALTLIFALTSTVHGYTVIPNIERHWAQSAVQRMVDERIIAGYPDGTFRPSNYITRAEFVSLIARACNLGAGSAKLLSGISPETVFGSAKQPSGRGVLFSDITGHWAEGEIIRAYYHGIVSGYSDSKFGPDDLMPREQALVMIVNALKVGLAENSSSRVFADSSHISGWAKEAVARVAAAGIITGYPDGTLRPQEHITRAEAVVILERSVQLSQEPTEEKETIITAYDTAGTYGPESGTQTINDDVTISADGVILRNTIIKGNLTITEEVGDGDVTLNNVTVEGTTYIRGGGKDSIHIDGGQYNKIIIESTPGGAVRLVARNADGLKVIISENAVGEEIILEGTFESVEIRADNVVLTTQGKTTIKEITVHEDITGTILNIDEDTTVKKLVLDSVTEVNNAKDTIENISGAKVSGSYIANPPRAALEDGSENNGSGVVARYILTLEVVPLDSGSVAGGGSYRSGQAVTVTATPFLGYVFINWAADSQVESTEASFEYKMPSNSITLAANFKKVEEEVDKAELQAAVNAALELKEEEYSEKTWADFSAALTAAQAVLAGEEATRDEVDSALATLNAAIETLEELETAPCISNYTFSLDVPGEITAGKEVEIAITFASEGEPGETGYEGVRFAFIAEGPGEVTFKATDSEGVGHSFVNEGYWGPLEGFDLPAVYEARTDWKLTFSQAGEYAITLSLIAAATEEVLGGITVTENVSVNSVFSGGFGAEDDPYIITTLEQLNEVRNYLSSCFELGADLDLNCEPFNTGEGWDPIGSKEEPFTGRLDGKGYTINNLFINRTADNYINIGLFGYTDNAILERLQLENVDIRGYHYVGGVVGHNVSGIVGHNVSGIINECCTTGKISGSWDCVGGLVGINDTGSEINNSYSECIIKGVGSSAGGLVGVNNGSIANSYATGSVEGKNAGGLVWSNYGTVNECYASGSVSISTSTGIKGGLVASNFSSGSVAGSCWDKETTGQDNSSGGGNPLTTAEMKQQDSFAGWDFTNVWRIINGETYPYLWWQNSI